jgi:hypothetical protein
LQRGRDSGLFAAAIKPLNGLADKLSQLRVVIAPDRPRMIIGLPLNLCRANLGSPTSAMGKISKQLEKAQPDKGQG